MNMQVSIRFDELSDVSPVEQSVATIDLTMVRQKLLDPDEGPGWDEEFVNWVEQRYRRFLCMLHLYPDGSIVPTRDIDLFWHQHILDTRAYAADCESVFGYFVHHYPYFGMQGDDDAQDLKDSFERTKAIYAALFEADYCARFMVTAGKCHKGGTSKCHKCRSQPGPDTIKCTRCKSR